MIEAPKWDWKKIYTLLGPALLMCGAAIGGGEWLAGPAVTARYGGFLRASLLWLVVGTSLGAAMAIHPAWAVYRPAHLHALLLGFVMMMIAGVAYHVIPRFTMAALHSPRVSRRTTKTRPLAESAAGAPTSS